MNDIKRLNSQVEFHKKYLNDFLESNDEEHVSSGGRDTHLVNSVSPEDTIIENNVYTTALLQE